LFTKLEQLRHTVWMVERHQLKASIVDEQALILPEKLVDQELQPHAFRWLSEQTLICVSGAKHERLVARGLRVFRVSVEVVGRERMLELEAEGGGRASTKLVASFKQLEQAQRAQGDEAGPRVRMLHPPLSLVDRLLRHMSRGALSEEAVVRALRVRELIEPGYGYAGSPDGVAVSVDKIRSELHTLDLLFEQVFARAELQQLDTKESLKLLAAARNKDATVVLPQLGEARRFIEEELTIELDGEDSIHYSLGGKTPEAIVLPEQRRWFVGEIDLWNPQLKMTDLPANRTVGLGKMSRWVLLILLLVVAALALFMLRSS